MDSYFYNKRLEDENNALKASLESKSDVDLENLTSAQALQNFFTGNYTFQREKALMEAGNAFSANQAQIARDYDTEMSNTAYQRKVADMSAAGINPYADLGSGAQVVASPSPSAYSAHTGSDSSGFGALASLLGKTIGGAFTLANTALKSRYRTQYFDSAGMLRGTTMRDRG